MTKPRRPHNFKLRAYNKCWQRKAEYVCYLAKLWGDARIPTAVMCDMLRLYANPTEEERNMSVDEILKHNYLFI